MAVELRSVDSGNVWRLLELRVREDQENFVATNTQSIVEAYTAIAAGGTALPFGIYDGETPVGFLMIGYDCVDWPDAPAIAHGSYNIWRLMIDRNFQGRGYGRRAMELALAYIAACPCGQADTVWLSYEPENAAARALYHQFGFRETGEFDGGEAIACRKIKTEGTPCV